MSMQRMRCLWSGAGVVGPAVTTFYFDSTSSGHVTAVANFFTAIAARIPNDCSILVPNTGDNMLETTGAIIGGWTDGSAVTIP